MGGVRLPPHTELLRDATSFTMVASFWLAIVAIIIAVVASSKFRRATLPMPWCKERPPTAGILTAALTLIVWAGLSIPKQEQVKRNHHLNELIEILQYSEAIRYASQFDKSDFSTIHYLPPNPYSTRRESYRNLLSHLNGTEPDWLRNTWTEQYAEALLRTRYKIQEEDALLIKNMPQLRQIIEEQAGTEEHRLLMKPINDLGSEQNSPPPKDDSAPGR